ncbi:ArnT family glycosyltransferase [Thioclava sp.]|uniref:ArnT family glycosyltransferase n=1 Tax=Thioclava sp. TaxID=1933450 RepID=UPI003AA8C720
MSAVSGSAVPESRLSRSQVTPVLLLTLAIGLVHLAMAGLIPVFNDEAYYALWATRLAPDYYDHPPMIALWIWVGEALLGSGPAGIRLVSVVGFASVTLLTWNIARCLGAGPRRAFAAALFYNIMALPAALGFTATPDAPSTFFWALSLWLTVRAADPKGGRRLWALAGVAAGLGVLSKFTNLFFGVGVLAWLLASREGRRRLLSSGPWIMAATTLLTLAPFLLWNATHEWYGFERQFSRLDASVSHGSHMGDYLAATILSVTPLLIVPVLRGIWRARGVAALMTATSLPSLLFLGYHALTAAVQANWIVPLCPGLAVLAAVGLRKPGLFRVGVPALAGGGVAVAGLVLAFWPGAPVFPGDNPANQTKGWPDMTRALGVRAEHSSARWIATDDYGTTGALALRFPALPVWQVTETRRYLFRYTMPHALCSAPGLLVQPMPVAANEGATTLFETAGRPEVLTRASRGAALKRYQVTEVRGLRTCTESATVIPAEILRTPR